MNDESISSLIQLIFNVNILQQLNKFVRMCSIKALIKDFNKMDDSKQKNIDNGQIEHTIHMQNNVRCNFVERWKEYKTDNEFQRKMC